MRISWSKSLSLCAVIHQHFLEQPTAGKVAEAALVAAASKRVYCFGSGRADAVSTLIVAASALATPFTWT